MNQLKFQGAKNLGSFSEAIFLQIQSFLLPAVWGLGVLVGNWYGNSAIKLSDYYPFLKPFNFRVQIADGLHRKKYQPFFSKLKLTNVTVKLSQIEKNTLNAKLSVHLLECFA